MKKNIKRLMVMTMLILSQTSVYAMTLEECLSLNAGRCVCIGDDCRIFYIIK